MRVSRTKRLASYALIAGGAFLLFQGAREFLESRWGQSSAEREFEEQEIAPREEASPPNRAETPPLEQPPAGEPFAKLTIPRLDAQLYVVQGIGKRDLRRGPGHMPGSAMPGSDGNCVIAGHRDTHFRVLKDIRRGDDIILRTRDGEFLYRVRSTRIVSPKNTTPLDPTPGPVLNLITCYPFYYVGNAPKRFIVEAELAGTVNASSPPHSASPRKPS